MIHNHENKYPPAHREHHLAQLRDSASRIDRADALGATGTAQRMRQRADKLREHIRADHWREQA